MKYMTPELVLRFRSLDDDIADAAESEWRSNCKAYRAELKAIYPNLPPTLQRLVRKDHLHDARLLAVRAIEAEERPASLSLLLALDNMDTVLELSYQNYSHLMSVNHPHFDITGVPLVWLYDELSASEPGTWTHSILFTGGRELQLTFGNLRTRRFVVPGGRTAEGPYSVFEAMVPGGWQPTSSPLRI
jgi:hypothetical protein